MTEPVPIRFGLTLSNRSIIIGMADPGDMVALAVQADREPVWDSVWVGDSIFAKPRLDAFVTLGALAARTDRVRLGVGCMASAPLRDPLLMAYQWASLDYLSGGRSIFVACQGQRGAGGGDFEGEFAAFGVDPSSRSERMEEAIEILRLTSAKEGASYEGTYRSFEDVTVLPRPVQQPVPIWVTANPDPRKPRLAERALRRVARLGDGWMTTGRTPEEFASHVDAIRRYAAEEGRELPGDFEACLYYNINVSAEREDALTDTMSFLEAYYGVAYDRDFVERWTALGPPEHCARQIQEFIDAGATTITLRLTSRDEASQFRRVTDDVLPLLA